MRENSILKCGVMAITPGALLQSGHRVKWRHFACETVWPDAYVDSQGVLPAGAIGYARRRSCAPSNHADGTRAFSTGDAHTCAGRAH
jgi:hypothetical protein